MLDKSMQARLIMQTSLRRIKTLRRSFPPRIDSRGPRGARKRPPGARDAEEPPRTPEFDDDDDDDDDADDDDDDDNGGGGDDEDDNPLGSFSNFRPSPLKIGPQTPPGVPPTQFFAPD